MDSKTYSKRKIINQIEANKPTKESSFDVEPFELNDVLEVSSLAFKSFKQIGKGLPEPVLEDLLKFFSELTYENDNQFSFKVKSKETNRIVGVLLASLDSIWWNKGDLFVTTVFFYVDPNLRSKGTQELLLNHLKEVCKE